MGIVYACAVPHPPLIVPAVGRGEEAAIAQTTRAYQRVAREVVDSHPDVLVVTSPHAPFFRDAFHVTTAAALDGSMADFGAPRCRIHAQCDTAFASALVAGMKAADIPTVDSRRFPGDMDHGTFVPLFFIREAYATAHLPVPVVRVGLSLLPAEQHRQVGRMISRIAAAQGKRVAFVASGDLSHKCKANGSYGFAPEGPEFDKLICEIFASGNLEELFALDEDFCEAAAECGLRSFQIMAGALEGLRVHADLLSHQDTFGVGYGVASFQVRAGMDAPSGIDDDADEDNDADEDRSAGGPSAKATGAEASADKDDDAADPYVALARLSVETWVRTGKPAALPDGVPAELTHTRAAVFVSLHKAGELRGCIGTIAPTCENVALEILQDGISACSEDPRFPAVQPAELDALEYSVDVLAPAELIASVAELDPARYGVIVTKGWRRGLLLPNLEGVDTVAEQVAIAKRKAGISPADADVRLERFEVVRHTRGGEARRG